MIFHSKIKTMSLRTLTLLACAALALGAPEVKLPKRFYFPHPPEAFFADTFNAIPDWESRWHAVPESSTKGAWKVDAGSQTTGVAGDLGLITSMPNKHHAIFTLFDQPWDVTDKPYVIQYDVRMNYGPDCGGAYIKLLTHNAKKQITAKNFGSSTPYTIMFGPDYCKPHTDRVHFILRHRNPVNGAFTEHKVGNTTKIRADKMSHVYTLAIWPNNTFIIYVDRMVEFQGNLLTAFTPLINPDLYIPDPNEKKPANWVDQAKIPDPDAKKPSWWKDDEPMTIPDPSATMPSDWQPDEPMQIDDGKGGKKSNPKCKKHNCGPWQAPQIQNPKYRLKWTAPMIDNPAYKGEWKPTKVHNPDHFIEAHPHNVPLLAGIGIEIWNHQSEIEFDNFYLGHDVAKALEFARLSWGRKYRIELDHEIELAMRDKRTPWLPFLSHVTFKFASDNPMETALSLGISLVALMVIAANCGCCSGPDYRRQPVRRVVKRAVAAPIESKPETSVADTASSAELKSDAEVKSDTSEDKVDEKAELMPSSEPSDASLSAARKRTVAE